MQPTPITTRYGVAADDALLAEMGADAFYTAFAADNTPEDMAAYLAKSFSPEIQADELARPGSLFLIAEADGNAVGYARLQDGSAPQAIRGEHPIEIVRFYARVGWQGKGVGAALMRACLDEAQRRSCDVIWLDVWERNLRAIRFYQRWGFLIVGTQLFPLGNDMQNDLLMQRPV